MRLKFGFNIKLFNSLLFFNIFKSLIISAVLGFLIPFFRPSILLIPNFFCILIIVVLLDVPNSFNIFSLISFWVYFPSFNNSIIRFSLNK